MPEFANRSEYERWRAEVVDRMRREEEESKVTWVCPRCCSVLPLLRLQCKCGYAAEQSLLRYFRGDITSSSLYEIVRNEFHTGDHGKALLLSRYLVRRFPLAKEAEHLREYGELLQPGMRGIPGERGDVPATKPGFAAHKLRVKTVIAAILAGILTLVLISFFWWHFSGKSDGRGQMRNVSRSAGWAAGGERADAQNMLQAKTEAEKSEEERLRSPQAQLGFRKGRDIARVLLTNKPSLIREKCYQAMLRAGLRDQDYLAGCMAGYDSHGLIWGAPAETAGRIGLSKR